MRHAFIFTNIVFLLCGATLLFVGSGMAVEANGQKSIGDDIPRLLVPRSMDQKNFPCAKCHGFRAEDRNKRKLKEYHIAIELKHAEQQRWCYDCHEGDRLKLQNGKLITFGESYYLCGQCHGTIFRDWKSGIHGKRTGMWDGDKLYRVCVNCHDPHAPRFKPILPKPPPLKPSDIK